MKRIMGIAASVAMAAGLLSGASVVSAADTEDVTLWYYWENEGHQQAMNEMIEAYNQSQDQYKMKANYVPFTDFKKQLSIGASANVVGTSIAAKEGHPISWGTYCKYSVPATLIVVMISMISIFVRYF